MADPSPAVALTPEEWARAGGSPGYEWFTPQAVERIIAARLAAAEAARDAWRDTALNLDDLRGRYRSQRDEARAALADIAQRVAALGQMNPMIDAEVVLLMLRAAAPEAAQDG